MTTNIKPITYRQYRQHVLSKTISKTMSTPSSHWAQAGEPDPHGKTYTCERSALTMGKLTDDELANGAFLNYDVRPSVEKMIAGVAFSPIVWMTAVKERIRWLSRNLDRALAENQVLKDRLAVFEGQTSKEMDGEPSRETMKG